MTLAIHQMLPSLVCGDAISNHVLALQRQLRAWGYRSEIYAVHRDPRFARVAHDYRRYRGNPRDTLIYHYGIGSPLTDYIKHLPDQVILHYHNITPAHLFRGHSRQFQAELTQGRAELSMFRDVRLAVADSDYNRLELVELGYRRVITIPVIIDLSRLDAEDTPAAAALRRRLDDGTINLLFVGRIVPNKRQQDLIALFAYYQRLIEPKARLILVGSPEHAPTYQFELQVLVEMSRLCGVEFLGQLSDAELAVCYRTASVFVSMSEHEGLGAPLLESMYCDVPVLAYAAAAVPYTLGDAGVLFHRKRYDVLAEVVDLLVKDAAIREAVVQRQRQRVAQFSPDAVAAQWRHVIRGCA